MRDHDQETADLMQQLLDMGVQEGNETAARNLDNHKNLDDAKWASLCAELNNNGTNNSKNLTDPFGDGDQSIIYNSKFAQFHKNVWSAGGDTHKFFNGDPGGPAPLFLRAVMLGDLSACSQILNGCRTQEQKRQLLEKRVSILRLPAIFFTVIGMGTVSMATNAVRDNRDYYGVMKLLIDNGARVDAKDLCGKTILHYVIGPLCVEGNMVPLNMADLCINKTKEMNLSPPIVDVRDRFGAVPLLQAIYTNRADLVLFLSKRHHANPHIADNDGMIPIKIVKEMPGRVGIIMRNALNKESYHKFIALCVSCGQSPNQELKVCSQCNVARYCDSTCQKNHWKIHKKECLNKENGWTITKPTRTGEGHDLYRNIKVPLWTGVPPNGAIIGEPFEIKIQIGPDTSFPFQLYDKTRELYMLVDKDNCADKDVEEIYKLILAFMPCDGRKAYFKANVSTSGKLFVSSKQLFVRSW